MRIWFLALLVYLAIVGVSLTFNVTLDSAWVKVEGIAALVAVIAGVIEREFLPVSK